MTPSPEILDYNSRNEPRVTAKANLATICATLTVATCFGPIWLNFADVRLMPAYFGSVLMVIGLRPLWRLRGWGIVCVMVGSVLLATDLIVYDARLAFVVWEHPRIILD